MGWSDGRGELGELLGRRHPSQRLARPPVELGGDLIQARLGDGEAGLSGEVLAQQAVGVLVAAALPRATRVTEVHAEGAVDAELRVLGHLLALVPRQRAA